MFNLALNPPFCQTAVMPSPLFSVVFVRYHFVPVLVRWLRSSFAVFCLACGFGKQQMCYLCVGLS